MHEHHPHETSNGSPVSLPPFLAGILLNVERSLGRLEEGQRLTLRAIEVHRRESRETHEVLFRRMGRAEQRLAQAEVRLKARPRRIARLSLKEWPWLHILAMALLFLLGLPNIAPEEARDLALRLLELR